MKRGDFKLVYVDGAWAWFSDDPANTWGDDWNDAPHFCNAGDPYTHREDGPELFKVAWDADLEEFGTSGERDPLGVGNGWFSVDDFNARKAPWLCQITYGTKPCRREHEVWGLCTFDEFCDAITRAGGVVYEAAA